MTPCLRPVPAPRAQIYNETITDLLNPAATNLPLREDIRRGVYVEGLAEEECRSGGRLGLLGRSTGCAGARRPCPQAHACAVASFSRSHAFIKRSQPARQEQHQAGG